LTAGGEHRAAGERNRAFHHSLYSSAFRRMSKAYFIFI
jgi:hypothetical protein